MKLEKNKTAIVFFTSLGFLACSSHTAPQTVANQTIHPPAKTIAPSLTEKGPVKPFYEAEGESVAASDEVAEEDITSLPVIGEEVEKEISQTALTITNSKSGFDIPMVVNQQVEKWIDYFQNRGRSVFASWLARSGRYIPMMQKVLRENGLPQDLVYLSMIESGFKPYAYSHAHASGPWQFINGTGSRYGLQNNAWIDERRDPEKSSLAAAQHLKDLYDQFNNWHLAAAGYNAGAGKIERAIARYSTEDFWEMSQYSYLKPETKNYVPKMLAAALVAKNPEKFGFGDVVYDEPLSYANVTVGPSTRLATVAQALNIDASVLKQLNPELKRGMVPPFMSSYDLKIPEGMKQQYLLAEADIKKRASEMQTEEHVVAKGESLKSIARSYGISTHSLARANGLRSGRVRKGQVLTVQFNPNSISKEPSVASVEEKVERPQVTSKTFSNKKNKREFTTVSTNRETLSTYKIRRGDTLWSISRKFNCSVSEIKSWNRFRDASEIKHGKTIRVMKRGSISVANEKSREFETASVKKMYSLKSKKMDELSAISKKHKMALRHFDKLDESDVKSKKSKSANKLKVKSFRL